MFKRFATYWFCRGIVFGALKGKMFLKFFFWKLYFSTIWCHKTPILTWISRNETRREIDARSEKLKIVEKSRSRDETSSNTYYHQYFQLDYQVMIYLLARKRKEQKLLSFRAHSALSWRNSKLAWFYFKLLPTCACVTRAARIGSSSGGAS